MINKKIITFDDVEYIQVYEGYYRSTELEPVGILGEYYPLCEYVYDDGTKLHKLIQVGHIDSESTIRGRCSVFIYNTIIINSHIDCNSSISLKHSYLNHANINVDKDINVFNSEITKSNISGKDLCCGFSFIGDSALKIDHTSILYSRVLHYDGTTPKNLMFKDLQE